jgi:hypothetical protein
LKRVVFGLTVVSACAAGGYLFLSQYAKNSAKEAVANIEREIEASIPGSDFTYQNVSADFMKGEAQVSDIAISVTGQTIVSAKQLKLMGNETVLQHLELEAVEGSLQLEYEDLSITARALSLSNVELDNANKLIDAVKAGDPMTALSLLSDLSVGELKLEGIMLSFKDGDEALGKISGDIILSGIKDGTIDKLNVSGSIEDALGTVNGSSFKGELAALGMSGLNFAETLNALAMNDEKLIIQQIQNAFGLSEIVINGLEASVEDESKAILKSGTIEIANNTITNFSMKDFVLQSEYEDVAINIGETQFKGLNLGLDYTSEEALIKNAAQLYGLTEIGITNASFNVEGNNFGIGELSLEDVVYEDGMVVKGRTKLNGLEIPLAAIKEMDRSTARTISNFTKSENFVLSLENYINFETQKETYDAELLFGVDDFASIKLDVALAGLKKDLIKKASTSNDIFQIMEIWGKISEDLMLSSISIDYTDDNLADIVLAEAPDTSQLVMMSGMQIDMMLGQYPEQARQLKDAITGFLEGRNAFKVAAKGQKPVKLSEMESLFMSGELSDVISFTFEGK